MFWETAGKCTAFRVYLRRWSGWSLQVVESKNVSTPSWWLSKRFFFGHPWQFPHKINIIWYITIQNWPGLVDNPLRIIFGLGISLKYWILSKIAPGIILIFWGKCVGGIWNRIYKLCSFNPSSILLVFFLEKQVLDFLDLSQVGKVNFWMFFECVLGHVPKKIF